MDVSFCGAAVTDELILELCSGLHRLRALSIRGCVQITDIGVDHIVKHSRLKKINFSQCKSISSEASKILNEKYEVIETASVCEAIAAWEQ